MSVDDLLKEINSLSKEDFKILFQKINKINNHILESELASALYNAFKH